MYDTSACNYDSDATDDDGSCTFVDGICETCENGVIVDNDTDNDGVCDDDEIIGCPDSNRHVILMKMLGFVIVYNPGVISIVENNEEEIQICDNEQVNLEISTYPSGAENSDNGTPTTVGWSYQWLINVGGIH